jgi:ubiquinone/menaquinone biosynthesis C-methylase UbiE
VDLDLALLKEIELRIPGMKKIFLINADLRFMPFPRDVFDYVLCSEVIEHLSENDAKIRGNS